jgi:hypothetical protein
MKLPPVTIVHGLNDAVAALAWAAGDSGSATLLSAPGAALFAGCGWWRALVEQARAAHPNVSCIDVLDCADATGQALAALRIGVSRLVLWPEAPGRDAVVAIADSMGGFVLASAPPANPLLTTSKAKSARPELTAAQGTRSRGNGDNGRVPG